MNKDDFNQMFGKFNDEDLALDILTGTAANFYRSFRRQKLGVVESSILTISLIAVNGLVNNPTEQEHEDGEDLS